MNRTISIVAFVSSFPVSVIYLIYFFESVLPKINSTFLEGRFWASWLVMGVFLGPLMLLIIYLGMEATGFHYTDWKTAVLVTTLCVLYLTMLAFIFSSFLPDDFEPVRSGMLPALILAFTMIIFSRTKYGKRFQDY